MSDAKAVSGIEGPYLDFARLADYLAAERDTYARLCARAVLEGNAEIAKRLADEYGVHAAKVDGLMAWYDEHREDPARWIGYWAHQLD